MLRKIYVASSWRNEFQQAVVSSLRIEGHEVYDFRNPKEGEHGFGWSRIDENWKNWTPEEFKKALANPIAQAGFKLDQAAMDWCDACVLVLPCGSSAHLEAGWCAGKGKPTCVYAPALREPELMYLTFSTVQLSWGCDMFCLTMLDVLNFLHNAL